MSYPKTNSWKEGLDCCLWDGVTCYDKTVNVVGLFSCSWLRGTIHSNSSLFQLCQLQRLNLAHNDFEHSQISPVFGLNSLSFISAGGVIASAGCYCICIFLAGVAQGVGIPAALSFYAFSFGALLVLFYARQN